MMRSHRMMRPEESSPASENMAQPTTAMLFNVGAKSVIVIQFPEG
jgi:hypothetical protein